MFCLLQGGWAVSSPVSSYLVKVGDLVLSLSHRTMFVIDSFHHLLRVCYKVATGDLQKSCSWNYKDGKPYKDW